MADCQRGACRAGLASVKEVASRLQLLRRAGLPGDLCKGVPPKLVERYARRSAVEEPNELCRQAEPLKATLMPAFSCRRTEDLTSHWQTFWWKRFTR
jgi:hypothetical protein